jgi:hypothetical protein
MIAPNSISADFDEGIFQLSYIRINLLEGQPASVILHPTSIENSSHQSPAWCRGFHPDDHIRAGSIQKVLL